MSCQDLEEGTFHDASLYFSEEEWKLLHDWQKDLYRNVMKEIHQALISLGPLIATTVCSLRTKETEVLSPINTWSHKRRYSMNHSATYEKMDDPDVPFKDSIAEQIQLNNPLDSDGRERNKSPTSAEFQFLDSDVYSRKVESLPIFIDPVGAEMGQSSNENNCGYEVVSFRIKNEEEVYCVEPSDNRKKNSSFGEGGKRKQKKYEEATTTTCTKLKREQNTSTGKANTKLHQDYHAEDHSAGQQWSENYLEETGEKTTASDNVYNNSQHFGLHQENSEVGVSQEYNEFENNSRHSQYSRSLQNTRRSQGHTWPECHKSFSLKEELIKHMEPHSKVGTYACRECGKNFLQRGNLFRHYRSHTGEKPCVCTFCNKSFTRKDYLIWHMRTHTGERPYKCTECDKSFTQKGEFNRHRKKHNGV